MHSSYPKHCTWMRAAPIEGDHAIPTHTHTFRGHGHIAPPTQKGCFTLTAIPSTSKAAQPLPVNQTSSLHRRARGVLIQTGGAVTPEKGWRTESVRHRATPSPAWCGLRDKRKGDCRAPAHGEAPSHRPWTYPGGTRSAAVASARSRLAPPRSRTSSPWLRDSSCCAGPTTLRWRGGGQQ